MLTEKTAKLIVRKKTNITHFETKDGEKKTKILVYVGNEGPGDSWEDCTCFLEVVNDELVIYPNDRHMQDYFEDFNFTKLIENLINDKNLGQEVYEHPNNGKEFLPVRKEESTNEVGEVKEIIIGEYTPKRKFLNFVSSVNGAKVRFIRDIAFIDGKQLSGMLDGVIFKVTICDEGTINFEEQKGTNLSDKKMIKRLIADIDSIDVTGYAQKFVVSGLKFTDIDGNPCFLEVEHQKPINVLASLFEEDKVEVSEKGLSILDMLFSDDEDEAEEKLELSEKDVEKIIETNDNSPEPNENLKSGYETYIEEQFRKMNENKIIELEDRIFEKQKDINKYKLDASQAESKVKETSEKLSVLETRLETLKPKEEPNGYVFRVSEELKLETGLDETTKNIADKIADIMKLKKDVLFDYLTGGYYNIYVGDKIDLETSINDKDFKDIFGRISTIDLVGKFTITELDGRKVIEYRGDLNWHQLTDKMSKKGFEQNVEFDKITGSNSYEQKVEEDDLNVNSDQL